MYHLSLSCKLFVEFHVSIRRIIRQGYVELEIKTRCSREHACSSTEGSAKTWIMQLSVIVIEIALRPDL